MLFQMTSSQVLATQNGPITRYKPPEQITIYFTYPEEISKTLFVLDTPIAIIPKKGSPIAVIRNPKLAVHTFDPAV